MDGKYVPKKITWRLVKEPEHYQIEQEVDSFGESKNSKTKLPIYEKTVNPNGAAHIEELKVTVVNDGRSPIKIYAVEEEFKDGNV